MLQTSEAVVKVDLVSRGDEITQLDHAGWTCLVLSRGSLDFFNLVIEIHGFRPFFEGFLGCHTLIRLAAVVLRAHSVLQVAFSDGRGLEDRPRYVSHTVLFGFRRTAVNRLFL